MSEQYDLKKVASAIYALETSTEEEFEGLQKEAGPRVQAVWTGAKNLGGRIAENALSGTATRLLTAGSLAATVGLASQVMKNRDALNTQNNFNNALAYAVTNNSIIASANREKVQGLAQSVYDIAPHAASDPNILSSVLANAVHGEGLDPRTARDLLDLEEKTLKVKQLNSPSLMDAARLGVQATDYHHPKITSSNQNGNP